MLPVIFVVLVVGMMVFSLSFLKERQAKNWLIHAHSRQLQMVEAYVDSVLSGSHIPTNEPSVRLEWLKKNTDKLLTGGEIPLSRWVTDTINISPSGNEDIQHRLRQERTLLSRLEASAERILSGSASDAEFAEQAREITVLGEQISTLEVLTLNELVKQVRRQDVSFLIVEFLFGISLLALGVSLARRVVSSEQLLESERHKRVDAETSLQASQLRFRSLFETANDALLLADSDLKIILFNPKVKEMFGYDTAELEGQSLFKIISERELHKQLEYLDNKRKISGSHFAGGSFETLGLKEDGEQLEVEVSVATWDTEYTQEQTFYTLIIRDNSERKAHENRLKELSRSNQELEHYTLIASHDLQEPLRKVLVYSDMLKVNHTESMSADSLRCIDNIQDSSRRMQQLISALLSYSRVTTQGRQFVQTDLNEVMSQAIADMEWTIEDTKAHIEQGPLPLTDADPVQMRQLFQNMLSNALKYGKPGVSPIIKISGRLIEEGQLSDFPVGYKPEADCYSQITISDNGIGFDEKYLDRIFKVFQRLHGRKEYYGTGIGLAICRKIVERHGGFITAHSTPGEGAAFIVTLPARHPQSGNSV